MASRRYSFESEQPSPMHHRYEDSPQRPHIQSPPPQYFPQSHQQYAQEPTSPVSAYRPDCAYDRRSPEQSYRTLAHHEGPPMPPPHRSSPTRNNYNDAYMTTESHELRDARSSEHGFDNLATAQTSRPSGVRPYPNPSSASSGVALLDSRNAISGYSTPYAQSVGAGSSRHSLGPYDAFEDSPYQRRSAYMHNNTINDSEIIPHNIADDGDDGFMPEPKRKSRINLSRERSRNGLKAGTTAGVAAGTATGAGLFAKQKVATSSSGIYDPVSTADDHTPEKSEWLSRQRHGSNRMRWIVGGLISAVIVIAVVAGVIGGVLSNKSKGSGGSGSDSGQNINNAATDTATNGDLDLNSPEIKKLMNNKNLHKVFVGDGVGMDYTPWGVQYPDCLKWPPSQNNVTRDMAVLSQLTTATRLYGNDCNATEMVLHAIDRLQLKDMKVWLGVWIDANQTTVARQMDQMYKLLEKYDHSLFNGVIIGNEALFRAGQDKASSHAELVELLDNARSNFTQLGYDLTVSTSDLGDNWDATLAQASHYVNSNVHPFFAGVEVNEAASWAWSFWQTHDVVLTGTESNQIISEIGWPSGGGTDYGNTQNVAAPGQVGAVASVANMNIFMNEWICQAKANGTKYFWFSAFDEPWKASFNTPGKAWEDKWGLFDAARNLKPGLKIPSCGT